MKGAEREDGPRGGADPRSVFLGGLLAGAVIAAAQVVGGDAQWWPMSVGCILASLGVWIDGKNDDGTEDVG